MNKGFIVGTLASTVLATVQAQTLEADWLYASPSGTWVERSVTLNSNTTALRFPVENMNPALFWWHSDDASAQVSWQSSYNRNWPKQGDVATSEDFQGEWTVDQVLANTIVLSQSDARRYWPMTQLHRLQWPASSSESNFEMTIRRESSKASDFSYAWQDYNIRAAVNYRIAMGEDPVLHQTLILTNDSPYDIESNGYSFSMTEQPVAVMHEMVSRMDAAVSAPVASQSQGVATLVSDQVVNLQANSNVWLPVTSLELQPLEKRYSLNWDTRMQGLQQANSQVKLVAKKGSLPTIAGPITLGVFDQQLPVLNSQYQPGSAQEATLSLGQSSLVTVESKMVGENQWQLSVHNRTDENATLDLMITHWNGNRSEKIPMEIEIKAQSNKKVEVNMGVGGKIRIDKK
ncbi:hypothetical protein KO489_15925 [Reinekea forsetii]|nr:hypothetical protein [Reinekea forsetii]